MLHCWLHLVPVHHDLRRDHGLFHGRVLSLSHVLCHIILPLLVALIPATLSSSVTSMPLSLALPSLTMTIVIVAVVVRKCFFHQDRLAPQTHICWIRRRQGQQEGSPEAKELTPRPWFAQQGRQSRGQLKQKSKTSPGNTKSRRVHTFPKVHFSSRDSL